MTKNHDLEPGFVDKISENYLVGIQDIKNFDEFKKLYDTMRSEESNEGSKGGYVAPIEEEKKSPH